MLFATRHVLMGTRSCASGSAEHTNRNKWLTTGLSGHAKWLGAHLLSGARSQLVCDLILVTSFPALIHSHHYSVYLGSVL